MARVLIVEDSPTQAARIRIYLENAGFQTQHAGDGLKAMSALRSGHFDLIVTDLQMPLMNGLELVEAVRSAYPTVPVVLVTAHGSEDVVARALKIGAASYVPKRNLSRDLVSVLTSILAMSVPDPDEVRIQQRLEDAHFRYILENDLSLVEALIKRLQGTIDQMGLCDRTGLIRTAVAIREALVNAIDHGNLELDSELRQDDERVYDRMRETRLGQTPYSGRQVHFEVAMTREQAVFTIRDEGPGFDPSKLPEPDDSATLGRIGGRGLTLIRALMDEVHHNEVGNQITLVKRAERANTGKPELAGQCVRTG